MGWRWCPGSTRVTGVTQVLPRGEMGRVEEVEPAACAGDGRVQPAEVFFSAALRVVGLALDEDVRPLTTLSLVAGSTPLTRTLQSSPMMGQEECHAEAKEIQRGVQA